MHIHKFHYQMSLFLELMIVVISKDILVFGELPAQELDEITMTQEVK